MVYCVIFTLIHQEFDGFCLFDQLGVKKTKTIFETLRREDEKFAKK